MDTGWTLIDNPHKREAARDDILRTPYMGLDTEYDSFRYFREKLCLIQISTESRVYIFDPLLDVDLSFLGQVFANPATVKIIHACDNDVRLLRRDYGFRFATIFDTYRAASLLGFTPLSLKAITEECLGVKLEKTKRIQRSRWDVRPLTDEQLEYAALDARHLIALYHVLEKRLIENSMERAAQEAFDKMTRVKWHEKIFNPKGFFSIEGYDDLEECQKYRLEKLYRWRFETARKTNTAPFLILSDRAILKLSKGETGTAESLTKAGILSTKHVKVFGSELIKMLGQLKKKMW